MARRWLLPLTVAALVTAGLAASGCGQSDKDRYVHDYKPLNDRLLRVGEAIGRAPIEAAPDSNAKLSARFRRYASDLNRVNKDIAALDTPGDLRADATALTRGIGAVVRDLEKISRAASRGDQKAVAATTVALRDGANMVNKAQNRLARATGADVGPR